MINDIEMHYMMNTYSQLSISISIYYTAIVNYGNIVTI